MAIYRHSSDLPSDARGAVVVVGNFDGVHRGHQAVIAQAKRIADEYSRPLMVLTFEPHPRQVFQPDQASFRLTPLRVKARALEEVGVDHLFVLHFDPAFAAISAEDFVQEVLVNGLGAFHAVIGWDFCFGHKRAGNAELLKTLGKKLGFGVTTVQPVKADNEEIYSSTRIRQYLTEGAPDKAARLLGRPWEVDGRVERGDRRGHTLGFPTANLSLGEYLLATLGVYAVQAGIDQGQDTDWRPGVANLGRRPTVDGNRVQLEVHFFDFDGDLYDQHLRVRLIKFLRKEKKFDGLADLKAQIADDSLQARHLLSDQAQQDRAAARAATNR